MAKKRKIKVRKEAKVKVKEETSLNRKEVSPAQAEHILGFAGGILVIIAAVIALISFLIRGILEWASIVSLLLGIAMVGLTWHIPKFPRISAIFLLILSIVAWILPPHGFIVGPILGLIGAIIVLVKK
ncbi:MAG: hypothetical protein QW484_02415 [Candidatus Pacearchaeota archaeon]